MEMIDLSKVIGVAPLTNNGSLLIHRIDEIEEKVLVSLSGRGEPEWCGMTEEYSEMSEEPELGFYWGELFILFCNVLRIDGGGE